MFKNQLEQFDGYFALQVLVTDNIQSSIKHNYQPILKNIALQIGWIRVNGQNNATVDYVYFQAYERMVLLHAR